MKKIFVLIMIAGISTLWLNADMYIKQRLHTDGYYYGGVNRAAEEDVDETWLGKKKIASFTKNRVTIVDLEKKRAFILNRNDKTYVESPLPLDLAKLAEDNIAPLLKATQYRGAVKDTGKTKKIGKWTCRRYEVNAYLLYAGTRRNESDSIYWASPDVPLDMEMYGHMKACAQKLTNYGAAFIEESKKIKGFVIARETLAYIKGFGVKSTKEVVEISEKDAPAGIYSIPGDYTKKEKLSIRDLRNR